MIAVRDNRDHEAFSALFDFFAPRLKGFIMRSAASAEQAEEIVQDVMLTIWRKASTFDPHRANASAWIYQIARNRQVDILRKERRRMSFTTCSAGALVITAFFIIFNSNWVKMSCKPSTTQSR